MIKAACNNAKVLASPFLMRNVCWSGAYSTTTQSQYDDATQREFLSSLKDGAVEMVKDEATGIATVTMNNPKVHNAFGEADSLKHEDYFDLRKLFTKRQLFDARVHLGHKVGVRNPYMLPYIYGNRLGCDILDLDQTVVNLHRALNFTAHIAYREGIILFFTSQRQNMLLVEQMASDCGEYSYCRFWRGGTFTNSSTMFSATTRLPDLCIFLSTHNTIFDQHTAITESTKMNIPTVAIIDSSSDPRLISYPVPGNDDTPGAVQLYCSLFKHAILTAKLRRSEDRKLAKSS